MKKVKLSLLGGDLRQVALTEKLLTLDADVRVYGLPYNAPIGAIVCKSITDAVRGTDAIILPVPVSRDSVHLNCVSPEKIKMSEIFELAADVTVLGGSISPIIKEYASKKNIRLIDYYDSEELKICNAYLSAEGAVSIAMRELDISVSSARIAVTGYGRIASFLSGILKNLGADVIVAARKERDLARAGSLGLGTHKLTLDAEKRSTVYGLQSGYDVIFNTVPSWIFDREFFEGLDKKTMIVELASAPGGFDPTIADKFGAKIINAQGIPGKYAPVSAGNLLFEFIEKILKKEMIL